MMLAILFAIKKWKAYLANTHFIIKTNHQILKHLLEQRFIIPSLQALVVKLMQFDYEIQFKQEKQKIL